MDSDQTLQVNDTNYINLMNNLRTLIHHTEAATSEKPRRGVRDNHRTEIEKAAKLLKEDVHRLITSPYAVQRKKRRPRYTSEQIEAIRAGHAVVKSMLASTPEEASLRENELVESSRRVAKALDPTLIFRDDAEDETETDKICRQSARLALMERKSYREAEDDVDLVGEGIDDDDDDDGNNAQD